MKPSIQKSVRPKNQDIHPSKNPSVIKRDDPLGPITARADQTRLDQTKLKCHQNWNVTKTEMFPKLKCHHNWNLPKKFFWKLNKISLHFFFKVHFRHNIKSFKNLRPHFQNSFFSQIYVMFSVLAPDWNTKKLLKTEQQCTFVYIMNFTNFYPFLGIFAV